MNDISKTEARALKLSFWVFISAPHTSSIPSGRGRVFKWFITSSARVPDGRPNDSEVRVTDGCLSSLSSNDGEFSCLTCANCDTSTGMFIGFTMESRCTSS